MITIDAYRTRAMVKASTSGISSVPLGHPFKSGLCERDRWVLAMQIGKSLKPCKSKDKLAD